VTTPDNREQLKRVYGPETWDVYELLDAGLEPNGPDSLYEIAGRHLAPGARVLDAGCRDAAHLIQLVERSGVTGVGVDPVELHVERARAAVEAAGVADRVELLVGVMQELPFADGHFDFVWCRDVLEQVSDLDGALRETHRVLKPGGHMLVYTTFATDRLSPQEAELLNRHLGNVPANLVESNVEASFARAGFAIAEKDVVGTEWREQIEERDGAVSRDLLRLSRLRRQRAALAERVGEEVIASIEAALHWGVFQFLGKLQPTVYVLRRAA
jgi:ubiquinone/menaquinone biosynthesis C-methylase UbiE